MILSKPSWAALTGEARLTARLDDAVRRLEGHEDAETALANNQAADSARIAELEAEVDRLRGIVVFMESTMAGAPQALLEQRDLLALQGRLRDLEADSRDLVRRLDTALQLIEGLALAAGFARWSGDSADWPAWVQHVSGQPPAE